MFFNPSFIKKINYYIYSKKHFILYSFYGVISISFELIIRNYLININFTKNYSNFSSILIGIIIMFFLNAKYNFNIPRYLFLRSFLYFIIIDFIAILLQYLLNFSHLILYLDAKNLFLNKLNLYDFSRLITLSFLFIVGYLFHLKIAFRDSCKVGVAIYAIGKEKIDSIYNKIGLYPDFIHVDVVDKTIIKNANQSETYKLEVVKAFWPNHKIETHIMSKTPSIWIPEVSPYSDITYFHANCDENIEKLIDRIKNFNSEPGIVIEVSDDFTKYENLINIFKYILILSIDQPGYSGQKFNTKTYEIIDIINRKSNRKKFKMCIDGGINSALISKIRSDSIVSGSDVLNSQNPKKRIMRLQTFSRYE